MNKADENRAKRMAAQKRWNLTHPAPLKPYQKTRLLSAKERKERIVEIFPIGDRSPLIDFERFTVGVDINILIENWNNHQIK
jgi:hypothetical protein